MWRLVRARALSPVVVVAGAWCLAAGCGGKSERPGEHGSVGAGAGGGSAAHTGGSRANGGQSGSTAGGPRAGRGGSAHAGAINVGGEKGAGIGAAGEGGVSGGGAAGDTSTGNAGDAGTVGNAGNAGDAGAAGTGKLPPGVCPSPSPFTTGLVGCGNESFVHRPEPLGCSAPPRLSEPRPGIDEECDGGTCDTCNQDMECGPGGYCLSYFSDFSLGYEHECYYPCVSDSDCDDGKICVCESASRTVAGGSGELGFCIAATCASDQDCPANHFCSSALNSKTCEWHTAWAAQFTCQTSADECSGPEECPGVFDVPSDQYNVCRPTSDGTKLVCQVETDCG